VKMLVTMTALMFVSQPATSADVAVGKALASAVCSACHGANGVSVGPQIPHLAGQRAEYLSNQLAAFKAGTRKSDFMAVIAPQLSDADVTNVAAFFASQPGAAPGAKSALPEGIASTQVQLPADLATGYTQYLVKNYPEDKQVALYYANQPALQAAAAGGALPDGSAIFVAVYSAKLDAAKTPVAQSNGNFQPDQLQSFTGMARDKGWSDKIPAMLRNENWNYALFKADRTRRTDINQAECLVCHKPKQGTSYLFMYDALRAAATRK
jgi:cytochrome c553